MFILNGTHQPSSCDDESIFARLREERLHRFLFAYTDSLRLVSPVGLTNPQLVTGDTETTDKLLHNTVTEVDPHVLLDRRQNREAVAYKLERERERQVELTSYE